MTDSRSRVIGLALAFLLVGCVAHVAGPRDTAPTHTNASKPSATNSSTDVLYVLGAGTGSDARVRAFDAQTGSVIRELPAGVVSRDRSTLYSTEYVNGATQTRVDLSELTTGKLVRSFKIDGAFRTLLEGGHVPVGPTADGRWLVLEHGAIRIGPDHVTQYAVVDTETGTSTNIELRDAWPLEFVAVSPGGKRLYVMDRDVTGRAEAGHPLGIRVYDIGARTLRATVVPGTELSDVQPSPLRSRAVLSPDGRWLFTLQTSAGKTPFIMALDTIGENAERIVFPSDQKSTSDRSMVWSLVMTRDGATLYAVNAAVGLINEIDARAMSVRRTGHVPLSRTTGEDAIAAVRQALFPAADAKDFHRSGAALSPDERTLYAADGGGITVIDLASLSARTWHKEWSFDVLAMSPDGERLYARANDAWNSVMILSTRDGAMLGGVRMPSYPMAVLRVDLR